MSREIKFRAWDKKANSMLPVEQWASRSWVAVPVQVGEEEWELNQLKLDEVELMQYTGLKDENGVEIYEGDVCKTDASNDEYAVIKVWWNPRTAQFCGARKFFDEGLSHDDISINIFGKLEVIGNIYQNPELLES